MTALGQHQEDQKREETQRGLNSNMKRDRKGNVVSRHEVVKIFNFY